MRYDLQKFEEISTEPVNLEWLRTQTYSTKGIEGDANELKESFGTNAEIVNRIDVARKRLHGKTAEAKLNEYVTLDYKDAIGSWGGYSYGLSSELVRDVKTGLKDRYVGELRHQFVLSGMEVNEEGNLPKELEARLNMGKTRQVKAAATALPK